MSTIADYEQKKKIALMCFKRGTEAMTSQNWDYAIDLFCQSALLCPENILYRKSLRGCEHRKYNDNKSGARFAGAKLMTVKGRLKKSQMTQNWADADAAAEEGLKVNPWDPQLNADMADACAKRGFDECAVFGYSKAVEGDPDNKGWIRALAALLTQRGDYANARSMWEKAYKLDPTDGEARSMMTQVDAKVVMRDGGYDNAGNTRDVQKGRAYDEADGKFDKSRSSHGTADGPGMSVEADLQRAIRKSPADVNNYTKLAMHYEKEKRLEDAVAMFAKAYQILPDPNILEQKEDCELEVFRNNLLKAKEAAAARPDDDTHRKNVVALGGELLKREIEVLSKRVERYPQNLQVKYELARRFMRAKKWALSIPLLQQSSSDTRLKAEALINLGKCFVNNSNRTLGLRTLERVLPEVNPHDGKELFCEAHYLLGVLYQEAGTAADLAKATNHFTEVIGVDYGFKDAADRLNQVQGPESQSGGLEHEA